MPEQPSGRHSLEALAGSRKSDSQLRLVRGDDEMVIPENAEPTDDSPTIISKHKADAAAKSQQALGTGHHLRGQKLAHFELLEPIGVGGMAAVIRARDTQLDRFVALKILPPEMSVDDENVRRFHQEARAAAKLDHENIARVFFCGEDKKLHFIAFEFVEGDNLRVLLERRGLLPVGEAVRYVLQIAAGLEHAASRGVVHRDIKPSNIIISPNGRAKLVDMGLARSHEPQRDQLTQSGVTLGTFDYISPEQALEPREADARSDIYSLGCTFYHMLTGQPPVPEGTAAKKLHHHQHVAPVDPRQLNPAIPDEVAAILMRMMAKDAKDRYQRPVHLVQHLMQVAQKVGAGGDVPEGVMFLDAPLPGAPRLRPVLTIWVAVLALGILLALISLAPPTKRTSGGSQSGLPVVDDGGKKKMPDPVPPLKNVELPVAPSVVASLVKLQQLLEDKSRTDEPISIKSQIVLDKTGLTFHGDKQPLVLQSLEASEPQTLRFNYGEASGDLSTGITIDGGSVEFRNLHFELQAGSVTPAVPVAMVAVKGGAKVNFVGCTFVQKDIPFRPLIDLRKSKVPLASVLVMNTDAKKKAVVNFEKCYWKEGQAAVALAGPAKVTARNCAFGPHVALFHLRGDSQPGETELNLSRCSAFVVYGPAFRLDDNHVCKLQVSQSIFSCPDTPDSTRDEIQLLRQTDAREPLVRFEGSRNYYHNLAHGLWVWPGETGNLIKANLEDFRDQVALNGGSDKESSLVATSPWAAPDPLSPTLKPNQAFQVAANVKEARMADMSKALGAESFASWSLKPLPPLQSTTVAQEFKTRPNEKIIDPEAPDNTPGVYQSLAKALPYARPGDVLLLKHGKRSRDIDARNLILDDQQGELCDLTIKAYPEPGNQPVLVLTEKTQEKDATLFKLVDGKVHFENLEFFLEPELQDYKAQAIIGVANGMVTFKNCAITMKQRGRVPLSVVTFLDPENVMKMPMMPARPMAQVHFADSLVRGEGELLTVRGSRPLELKLDNSLVALAGSMLLVQGGNKDVPMDMPAVVKMSRVSAFFIEPVFSLRAGKTSRTLGQVRCEPVRDSLFIALGEKPLVTLENLDATEEMLKQYFDWKGEKNAHVNIDRVLELFRPTESPPLTLDVEAWRRLEPDALFLRASSPPLTMPLLSLRPLSQMTLDHFKAKAEIREQVAPFGATLDPEVLPRFTAPRKLEIVNTGY